MSIEEFVNLLSQHQMLLVYLALLFLVFFVGLNISDRKAVTSSLMSWQIGLNLQIDNFNTLTERDALALKLGCLSYAIALLSTTDVDSMLEINLRKLRAKYGDESINILEQILNKKMLELSLIARNKNNANFIKKVIKKKFTKQGVVYADSNR